MSLTCLVNMVRLKMIWWILTKKYVSVYWAEECNHNSGYDSTAPDTKAANMACNMCMWAKSKKYHKEQLPDISCGHFEY